MENLTEIYLLKLISKVDDIHSIVTELQKHNCKEVITISEAIKLLKVSKSTIERYISDGILDVVRIGKGKRRLITMASIKNKIENGII